MLSWNKRFKQIVAIAFICCFSSDISAQVVLIGNTGPVTNFGPTSSIVDINLLTGEATNPRDTGLFALAGIAAHPTTGVVYGLTTTPTSGLPNRLVTIDLATGAHTVVGNTGLRIVEGDLAFNPVNGVLYGIQDVGTGGVNCNLFTIDLTTGASTVIGNLGSSVLDVSILAINSLGEIWAIDTGADGSTDNSRLLRVSPANGSILYEVEMNVNLESTAGMAFHPITGTAFVGDGGIFGTHGLYELDLVSGNALQIATLMNPGGVAGLAFVNVPEPSSLLYVVLFSTLTSLSINKEPKHQSHAANM